MKTQTENTQIEAESKTKIYQMTLRLCVCDQLLSRSLQWNRPNIKKTFTTRWRKARRTLQILAVRKLGPDCRTNLSCHQRCSLKHSCWWTISLTQTDCSCCCGRRSYLDRSRAVNWGYWEYKYSMSVALKITSSMCFGSFWRVRRKLYRTNKNSQRPHTSAKENNYGLDPESISGLQIRITSKI